MVLSELLPLRISKINVGNQEGPIALACKLFYYLLAQDL